MECDSPEAEVRKHVDSSHQNHTPNMAHIRQSRQDYGLGCQVEVLKTFESVTSWLGSGSDLPGYTSPNFGAGSSPGTPNWRAQINRKNQDGQFGGGFNLEGDSPEAEVRKHVDSSHQVDPHRCQVRRTLLTILICLCDLIYLILRFLIYLFDLVYLIWFVLEFRF